MTLAQIIKSVSDKAYGSRTREQVIEAINEAARRVYAWIRKETPNGHFMKWYTDAAFSFGPGDVEVQLPPDCKMIARLREKDPTTAKWRIIHSTDLTDIGKMQGVFESLISYDDEESPFRFYGPYEKDDGRYYVTIQADPTETRLLELVYSASYVEIEDDQSYFMIPEEARGIVKNYALAECLEDNDDTLAQAKEARADKDLTLYLYGILHRENTQDRIQQEPYL